MFNFDKSLKTVKGFKAAAEQQWMMVSDLCFGPQVGSWGRIFSRAALGIGVATGLLSAWMDHQSGIYAFWEAAINETTSSENRDEVRTVT